jgi:hypothetical protein
MKSKVKNETVAPHSVAGCYMRIRSSRCLLAASVLIGLSGCEDSGRKLPPSEFELTRSFRADPKNALNIHGLRADLQLTFTYKGPEKLEDVNLSIEVWLPSGEKPTFKLYQAVWQAGGDKVVEPELRYGFSESIQKVILRGNARIGSERVAFSVEWTSG